MRLVLFRHGPAGHRDARRWPDDSKRPLTRRGEERTRAAARGLRRLIGPAAVSILTSPYLRCARTAELLRECFEVRAFEPTALLAPGSPFRPVLTRLREFQSGETVILVGHEPDLGKLTGTLLFGAPSPLPIRKSGACVVRLVAEVQAGAGILEGFYAPRVLRRLAGRKVKT